MLENTQNAAKTAMKIRAFEEKLPVLLRLAAPPSPAFKEKLPVLLRLAAISPALVVLTEIR